MISWVSAPGFEIVRSTIQYCRSTTLLKKNFDFPCLRFVDVHCCPAIRTGRGFLVRRAAVWHWGLPYISQHQPKDPKIKSNQKPEGKHATL